MPSIHFDDDEYDLYKCAAQSRELTLAMWSFYYQDLRELRKYSSLSDEEEAMLERIEDMFIARLEDYNVDLTVLS